MTAVFGPSDPILGQHIHSICDALDIPHLEARLDLGSEAREFSINLHPAQSLLNAAYMDVMEFLNWTKVAIIYEDDYSKTTRALDNYFATLPAPFHRTRRFYAVLFARNVGRSFISFYNPILLLFGTDARNVKGHTFFPSTTTTFREQLLALLNDTRIFWLVQSLIQ